MLINDCLRKILPIDCADVINSSTPSSAIFSDSNSASSRTSVQEMGSIWFWKTFSSQTWIVISFLACVSLFPWSLKMVEIYNHGLLVLFSVTQVINYWEAIWAIKWMHSPSLSSMLLGPAPAAVNGWGPALGNTKQIPYTFRTWSFVGG